MKTGWVHIGFAIILALGIIWIIATPIIEAMK